MVSEATSEPLKIGIDAQLLSGGLAGGVEQFVIGLVHALGQLDDGPEEYIIIGPWQDPYWLESYLGPNQRIVTPGQRSGPREQVKRLFGPLWSPVRRFWRSARRLVLSPLTSSLSTVPESDGFYESLGVDVIHFPHQGFVRCDVPTIYNPHDLQYLHYPQFFTPEDIAWREIIYQAGCRYAQAVAAESQWVKDDINKQFGIAPQKIYAIPRGAPTALYEPITNETLTDVVQKFQLPQTFVFYPAQTWPHKNHIRLLEAIRLLRDQQSLLINLVCTGRTNDFWPDIEKRIYALGLEEQIRFLGFVRPEELRALYGLAQFVVFPSLFEGGGFPVLEAFQEGTPVACSAVTSLPEYGGDATLPFDPTCIEDIAEAMLRMATDAELRTTLCKRGARRIGRFTWARTAKAYRALYRKVTGHLLSEEEHALLVSSEYAERKS